MNLFEQIVAGILTEDVEVGKINDAIDKTYEVLVNYQSDDDNASGERIIYPVAYGMTKAGNPAIRAYQPEGDTQSKVPAWKLFLVSGIQSWKPHFKKHFDEPPGYNPNGDRSMSEVLNQAIFGNPLKPQVRKTDSDVELSPVNHGPITKDDIEKKKHITAKDNPEVQKMEKLRKQLENPRYLSDYMDKSKDEVVPATSGPITKQDVEPENYISVNDHPEVKKLEKLRKQLDNPRYISDIIKDKTFGTKQSNPAPSGPITKDTTFKTQTEKDIESRRKQMNKGERVSQSVLDNWNKEQEKRKNKYGSK